jgi:hypothetical protein
MRYFYFRNEQFCAVCEERLRSESEGADRGNRCMDGCEECRHCCKHSKEICE